MKTRFTPLDGKLSLVQELVWNLVMQQNGQIRMWCVCVCVYKIVSA